MYKNEHGRNEYDYDRDRYARADYARYDYEGGYEQDRMRTTVSYRNSLESSLERPASRTRLERADDARYDYYLATGKSESNYDKFFDSKRGKGAPAPSKRKMPLVIAYVAIALVAVIAVTLAVVGVGKTEVTEPTSLKADPLFATAEEITLGGSAAAEQEVEEIAPQGGENYIMLKNGELVAIEVPAQTVYTPEEENWFDKLCGWLNGVFGG